MSGVERHGETIDVGAARVKLKSANRKLSPVDQVDIGGTRKRPVPRGPYCCSTYLSIAATCSSACPLKNGGCYVQAGFTKRTIAQLDARAQGRAPFDVALDEIIAIDAAFPRGVPQDGARGGRDLRLHDSGDAATNGAAILLGEAAKRWKERGGGSTWTFTHSWRDIDRTSWGPSLNVLASIETPSDIRAARAKGYAPAIVVERHDSPKAYELEGTKIIPCPAETLGRTCVECRLCLDRDLYSMRAGIAFAVHGLEAKEAVVALRVAGRRAA